MLEPFGIICFIGIFKEKKKDISNPKKKVISYIKNIFLVSISAQILIMPIIAYSYKTVSLTFFITSILTSFLIGAIIIFGFLLILISFINLNLAVLLGNMYKLLINMLELITEYTSKIPLSKIYIKVPYLCEIILYYIVIFTIYYFYKKFGKEMLLQKFKKFIICYKKIITIISVIVLVFSSTYIKVPKKLQIYFIDVGQGDSCLIITPNNRKILIDGGGSENYDIGKNTLIPYLLNRRITSVDYIIFSHFDTDHSQGLTKIIEELNVKNVIIGKQFEKSENYAEFVELVRKKNIKVNVVEAGQKISVEKDLHIYVLWPDSKNVISDNVLNNNSLVCKLIYKNFSMLFTGDIEERAEMEILQKYKNNLNLLNATVLKVAHHGSKTSSNKEFLEAVEPKIALIGVGRNNTFGHPSNVTLENLEKIGCKIYRTDEMGEIIIQVDKNGKIWNKYFRE